MTLYQLFNKCAYANYKTIENTKADYALSIIDDTLYILLQWSNQKEDWKHNFDFPAKPYKDMPRKWKAHRGFVKVWKSIIPYIEQEILNPKYKKIIIIGYSHGAAIACLAHEYVWFNRPDIRDNCYTFAFESPRVFCGWKIPEELKERWNNLFITRNGHDIVTHTPPALFGFKHVGNLIRIRRNREKTLVDPYLDHWYIPKCVKEHDFPAIRKALKEYKYSDLSDRLKEIFRNI